MSDHDKGEKNLEEGNRYREEVECSLWILGAPQPHIVPAQSANQFSDILRNASPARASLLNLPGPVPTKTSTVPVDNGGRFHDPEYRTAPIRIEIDRP